MNNDRIGYKGYKFPFNRLYTYGERCINCGVESLTDTTCKRAASKQRFESPLYHKNPRDKSNPWEKTFSSSCVSYLSCTQKIVNSTLLLLSYYYLIVGCLLAFDAIYQALDLSKHSYGLQYKLKLVLRKVPTNSKIFLRGL